MLLIKGLSHKEIATVPAVGGRTVRSRRSIYSKAGLQPHRPVGVLLEDLLAPSKALNSRGAVRMQRTARCAEARTRRTGLSDCVLACALGLLPPGLAAHAGDAPSSSIDEVEDAEGRGAPRLRGSDRGNRARPWLTWIGARLLGVSTSALGGLGGYWLDTAWVGGEERLNGLPEDRL